MQLRYRLVAVCSCAFVLAVATLVGIAAARARSDARGPFVAHAVKARTAATENDVALDVPASAQPPVGYGTPTALAADPSTGDIWLVAASQSDLSVFRWSASTGELASYSLGSPESNSALQVGDEGGLAVAPDGLVFVGLRDTLFVLTPSTGEVESVSVPPPVDNSLMEARRPDSIRGFHGIEALAVSPTTGRVAIAMEAANSISVYDPQTNHFSTVALPESDAPTDVAYTDAGSLVVSAIEWPEGAADVIDVIAPSDGAIARTTSMDAMSVTSDASGVLVTGSSGLILVSASLGSSPTETSVYSSDGSYSLSIGTPAAVGSTGMIVAAAQLGRMLVFQPGSSDPEVLQLPSPECNAPVAVPATVAGAPTTTVPPSGTCQLSATSIAIDNLGDIWYTTNIGTGIAEVPAGNF